MPKKTTDEKIDALAATVGRAFADLEKQIRDRFNHVDQDFAEVRQRFDHIENILITGQENRLSRVEDSMRQVRTKLGL
jgi:hypothetical protein